MSNNHSNGRIDDIEKDIDRDRNHLSQTISALEERLSPGQIFDQVWTYARRNGGTFSDNLVRTVSNNPVPVIMTAVGIAWMAMGRNRDDRSGSWYSEDEDYPSRASYGVDPAYDDTYGDDIDEIYGNNAYSSDSAFGSASTTTSTSASSSSTSGSSTTDKARGKASELKNSLSGKAKGAKSGASDSMHRAGDRARHLTGDARRSAQQMRDRSRRQWQQASHGARDFFESNPLAVGAAALAVGALIGAALPATEAEKRMVGGKGEELADRAKAMAKSSMDDLTEAGKAGAEAAKKKFESSSTARGQA